MFVVSFLIVVGSFNTLLINSPVEAYDTSQYQCSWYKSRYATLHIPKNISRAELDSYSNSEGCCVCQGNSGNFDAIYKGRQVNPSSSRRFTCYSWTDYCENTTLTSQTSTPVITTTESALDKCRKPTGDGCSWYKECLNQFHDCKKTEYEYAVKFGEKYCEKYQKNFNKFSPEGRKWIGKVRKCLQDKLAKQVLGTDKTCQDLQTAAFNSHPVCYAESGFCELGCIDWYESFKTVSGALVSVESPKVLKNSKDTISRCPATKTAKCSALFPILIAAEKPFVSVNTQWMLLKSIFSSDSAGNYTTY